jgi:HAMP domain-containing protein
MTDLETACRELVRVWEKRAKHLASQNVYGEADGYQQCANELERALPEHTPDAADRLAEKTGEPREKFDADEKAIPEVEELESEVEMLVAQMEAAADE